MKSIPVHLLVESQEHVVTVELSSGETYRGRLVKSQDNMNLQLANVLATSREGVKSHIESVFVRGSHIVMIILPEILQFAPSLRIDLAAKAKEKIKLRKQQLQTKLKKPPRKQLKTG